MGPAGGQQHWGAWGQPVLVEAAPTNRYNTDVSTVATIQILRRHARQYASDPSVLAALFQAGARLSSRATQRDWACAIFYYVRHTVRFVDDESLLYEYLGVPPDELDKELLIVPPVLLRMPQPMGDCDDFSLLIASMSLAAGIQPYYVTVAADPMDGVRKFSHIYVCVYLADEGNYLALDAGNRFEGVPPGWESGNVTRKAIWKI